MYPKTELVTYRLKNGAIVEYYLDVERGITIEDIDAVGRLCVENFQEPVKVFIRHDLYACLLKELVASMDNCTPVGFTSFSFNLTCGSVVAVCVLDSYIPFLVGDDEDYADNDFYKVFEEAMLKDA